MIADFGLSKKSTEATSNSMANGMGMVEYIDPQRFKIGNYKKDKKSDVYSLGVLFWEITSGRPPFLNLDRISLCYNISNNLREVPIEGTPLEYQMLYQKCWDGDPKLRPDIYQVYDQLKSQ